MNELAEQLDIPSNKLNDFAGLLAEHNFIKYDDKTRRIKFGRQLLPPKEEPTEPRTAVATLVIPAESSINIQSTRISNLSNVEIEVNLRIDNKIREVAIKT
jgi:hypothetical protein